MSNSQPDIKEAVERLATRTDLNKSTIRNLLERGWTWEEKINETPRFVHPIAQVMRTVKQ